MRSIKAAKSFILLDRLTKEYFRQNSHTSSMEEGMKDYVGVDIWNINWQIDCSGLAFV